MTSYGIAHSGDSDDVFDVKAWDETVIAVVADGVGGARAGREAATKVVRSIIGNYEARPESWSPRKALTEFTHLINRSLYEESMARYESPEMVSTLSVAVIEGKHLYGLNVGDSRIYLSRNGGIERLSEDHIVVGHPKMSHVLSRAIGIAPDVEPHIFEKELHDGDMALLCSDGISKVLDDEAIKVGLDRRSSARTLVLKAREESTPETLDDMCAVVLDIQEAGMLKDSVGLPLEIPEKLAAGDVVEGYTLVRPFPLTDRVWVAEKGEHRVVMKFAPLEAIASEQVLNRFVTETWNATRNEAPFFPSAFIPENATTRCYCMEFIDAPTLAEVLSSNRLSVDEAVQLGRFLLDAAQCLIRFDLVHGDIKPENILVLRSGGSIGFRLIDFSSSAPIFSVTSRAGTASYLAPERFHDAPATERTEIFAIGVTLTQALTLTLPYGEIERFQTPSFSTPKRPASLNANIPGWLDSILLRAVATDPDRRYRHYSELVFDLDYPKAVKPFHHKDAPLIERDPVLFYKSACLVLLAVVVYLLFRLNS